MVNELFATRLRELCDLGRTRTCKTCEGYQFRKLRRSSGYALQGQGAPRRWGLSLRQVDDFIHDDTVVVGSLFCHRHEAILFTWSFSSTRSNVDILSPAKIGNNFDSTKLLGEIFMSRLKNPSNRTFSSRSVLIPLSSCRYNHGPRVSG